MASMKPPAKIYDAVVTLGEKKASNSVGDIFKLGIISGAQIGLGAFLAVSVGGACPGLASTNPGLQKIIMGAFGLPMGLLMTLVTGAELATGNFMLVAAAFREGVASARDLWKSWTVSFAGNFVGSLIVAYLAFYSNTLNSPTATAIAVAKTSQTFVTTFVRGIICSYLVAIAVYMAAGAESLEGKLAAIFFPISGFVAMGMDHCIANMFLIPLGMLRGAEITVVDFLLTNLLPVTLGNIVGCAFCVSYGFGSAFGKKKKCA